ncbi:MAG: glutamate--tRNA ligase [Candidatus Accumulibacter sp.]|jgi:glutamyl-tRNA synthetase|nr:glutamate--tRNA ligase [Accumulibacter sp.]
MTLFFIETTMVRTRFAPSPTGFLHIGGVRTALFSWAYARHHGGKFILRIEDTDAARSTPEAVQAIIDGMDWLGLEYDEGPFYQMQRVERYKAVIHEMLENGSAYYCYMTPEELERLREEQRAKGLKPRYDGTWRPEVGKTLPAPPDGVRPVVRFRNPVDGAVAWKDLVKGYIEIDNTELDDLVIARADLTPTYNFCVVVDDWDMGITHVIRGDDHVNNTPRQINILRALGAAVPQYGHLSMILGDDGQKLSKRHGAVSVMQYDEKGYLPEAVLNYLARLGWSHGDDEIFSMAQFCEWFDLGHITPSAAQFNTEKLNWLNSHYIKQADNSRLASLLAKRFNALGVSVSSEPSLDAVTALYKERVSRLDELAEEVKVFYTDPEFSAELLARHLTSEAQPALETFIDRLERLESWDAPSINALLKECLKIHNLKMPKLAMLLRLLLTGREHTPSIDAIIALFPRDTAIKRLKSAEDSGGLSGG